MERSGRDALHFLALLNVVTPKYLFSLSSPPHLQRPHTPPLLPFRRAISPPAGRATQQEPFLRSRPLRAFASHTRTPPTAVARSITHSSHPTPHTHTAMDDDAAAQRAWELEMEVAVESRGRTRSRSILATTTTTDDDDDDVNSSGAFDEQPRSHELDVVDGGHDPTWTRSNSGGSAGDMRSRARSFSARRLAEMESEEDAARVGSGGRRRSRSFSSLQQRRGVAHDDDDDDDDDDNDDAEDAAQIVKRAASLSKIYLVGSAPVDVSKLQDKSKIVGVKKVEVVQPTGALSAKALDALSEGLQQLSADHSSHHLLAKDSARGQLTEEQLEEKKMEEEEDHKLKAEKLSTRKTLTARASLFKAKVFKSKAVKPPSPSEATAAKASAADKTLDDGGATDVPVVPKKRHKLKLLLLGDSGTWCGVVWCDVVE